MGAPWCLFYGANVCCRGGDCVAEADGDSEISIRQGLSGVGLGEMGILPVTGLILYGQHVVGVFLR